MAAGKGKRSSGANEVAPATNTSAPATETTPSMPGESAFAGLRQKIEQRLKNQNQSTGKGKKDNTKPSAPAANASANKGKQSPAKPSRPQDSAQGKKRDRNGEVIAREQNNGGMNKQEKPKGGKKSNDDETLRQEIMAMGGTEEDLDLLAGVDSESEVEGESGKVDDDLRKQLSSMLEAAGHVVPEDLADDEVEEDEIEDDEEEVESEDDLENSEDNAESSGPESDIEEAPAPRIKDNESVVPKEYLKLVSCAAVQHRKAFANMIIIECSSSVRLVQYPYALRRRRHETHERFAPPPYGARSRACQQIAAGRKRGVCGGPESICFFFPQVLLNHHGVRYPER